MKKLIAILTTLMLACPFAMAGSMHSAAASADGPAASYLEPNPPVDTHPVTISLDANPTTGFSWTGFVLHGDSIVLSEGTYVADDAPGDLCGVGGKTYYTLIPVKPGASVVSFTYAQPWEPENGAQRVIIADVDDERNLYVSDVTEGGVLRGTVLAVDGSDHTALVNTETHGEIIASFDAEVALPVVDEQIVAYTNGIMTASLPARVNVIAWETVPVERARTGISPLLSPELAIAGGRLVGAYYHCSGDELGNFFSAGLDWTEDATLVLTVQEQDAYTDPLTVSRYAAANDTLARIAEIVNAYHMETWYERKDAVGVCDAAYPVLVLVVALDNGVVVNESFSAYIDYTDAEFKAWKAVKALVLEGTSGELLETYQIEGE